MTQADIEFFYCPYCGGQGLFPIPDLAETEWECRACLRTFTVTLMAVGHPPRRTPEPR